MKEASWNAGGVNGLGECHGIWGSTRAHLTSALT